MATRAAISHYRRTAWSTRPRTGDRFAVIIPVNVLLVPNTPRPHLFGPGLAVRRNDHIFLRSILGEVSQQGGALRWQRAVHGGMESTYQLIGFSNIKFLKLVLFGSLNGVLPVT